MQLYKLISPTCISVDNQLRSKTAVLNKISQLISTQQTQLTAQDLFDAYWKRETLGSTGIGKGIAIPHVRIPSINAPIACFIKLQNPVDFGAEDKQPADLIIGLAVPFHHHQQHLEILSTIIKLFSNQELRKSCRNTHHAAALYHLLMNAVPETEYA